MKSLARVTNQILARMLLAQLRAALCISRAVGEIDSVGKESDRGQDQTSVAGSFTREEHGDAARVSGIDAGAGKGGKPAPATACRGERTDAVIIATEPQKP